MLFDLEFGDRLTARDFEFVCILNFKTQTIWGNSWPAARPRSPARVVSTAGASRTPSQEDKGARPAPRDVRQKRNRFSGKHIEIGLPWPAKPITPPTSKPWRRSKPRCPLGH
jgi:hypothetical protein